MRYYRIWIYTCNTVLMVCVVCFAVIAHQLVVADQRRHLVPGLDLCHPSLLYVYAALLVQCTVLQVVGFLGARSLSERLLNVYWLLLLGLLVGDAVLGVYWLYRYDEMVARLKPALRRRLADGYGHDRRFTAVWDGLQRDHECCGVGGPPDFYNVTVRVAAGKRRRSGWETGKGNSGTRRVLLTRREFNFPVHKKEKTLTSRDWCKRPYWVHTVSTAKT